MKHSLTMAVINVMFSVLYIKVLWLLRAHDMFIPVSMIFIGSQIATWIPWWNLRRIERNNECNL